MSHPLAAPVVPPTSKLRPVPGTASALAVLYRYRATVSALGPRFRPRPTVDPETGAALPRNVDVRTPAFAEFREAAATLYPLGLAVLWQAGRNLSRYADLGQPFVVRDPDLDVDGPDGREPGYRRADIWSFADPWVPVNEATPDHVMTGLHVMWAFCVAGAPEGMNPEGVSSVQQLCDALRIVPDGEAPTVDRPDTASAFAESLRLGWNAKSPDWTAGYPAGSYSLETAREDRARLASAADLFMWRDAYRIAFHVAGTTETRVDPRPLEPVQLRPVALDPEESAAPPNGLGGTRLQRVQIPTNSPIGRSVPGS